MTVKHTPGPWHLVLSDNATPHIMHEHGDDWTNVEDRTSLVCHTPAEITRSYNALANARLIAAAPEILDALQGLLAAYSKSDQQLCCDGRDCGCMGSTVRQLAEHHARAAIAKATGK